MRLAWVLLLVGCGHAAAPSTDLSTADLEGVVDDGTPMRMPCSTSYGTALTSVYGRLDGELVAVLGPSTHACNADSDHVHLQVRANGAFYDIAVNVLDNNGNAVDYLALDHALYGSAWSEGWHPDAQLDYPSQGLHSTDFAPVSRNALSLDIANELETANHVSVFASSYTDGTGAHLVHRNGFGQDGAIVVRPLSAVARVLVFHFADQTF